MDVGSVGNDLTAQAAVDVQRKALDNQKLAGEMALRLIESAAPQGARAPLPPDATFSVYA